MNIKNFVEYVKLNKATLITKALIIGGTATGLILTAGLLKKASDDAEETAFDGELTELMTTENPTD